MSKTNNNFSLIKENLGGLIFSQKSLERLNKARNIVLEINNDPNISPYETLDKFYAASAYVDRCGLNRHKPEVWKKLTGLSIDTLFNEKGIYASKEEAVVYGVSYLRESNLLPKVTL